MAASRGLQGVAAACWRTGRAADEGGCPSRGSNKVGLDGCPSGVQPSRLGLEVVRGDGHRHRCSGRPFARRLEAGEVRRTGTATLWISLATVSQAVRAGTPLALAAEITMMYGADGHYTRPRASRRWVGSMFRALALLDVPVEHGVKQVVRRADGVEARR